MGARRSLVSLAQDEVHVFAERTADVDLEAAEALLPPDEIAAMRRFHFERHRREHTASRALVRRVLSRYRDVEPRAWQWSLGPYGRPAIDPACGLYFNATNHVDVVACAVALHPEIGIDVEPLSRGDEILSVERTVFSTREIAMLATLPIDARRDRAVTLWTAKEALIKALGLGFSAPLLEMTLDVLADPPRVLSDEGWFIDVRDEEGARIAVAVRGPPTRPRFTRMKEGW